MHLFLISQLKDIFETQGKHVLLEEVIREREVILRLNSTGEYCSGNYINYIH